MKRRYFVNVRSYFDKVNGNSYFSLRAYDNETGTEYLWPKTYGSGYITYLHALALLINEPVDPSQVWLDTATVTRQKDLHRSGS